MPAEPGPKTPDFGPVAVHSTGYSTFAPSETACILATEPPRRAARRPKQHRILTRREREKSRGPRNTSGVLVFFGDDSVYYRTWILCFETQINFVRFRAKILRRPLVAPEINDKNRPKTPTSSAVEVAEFPTSPAGDLHTSRY